MYTCVRVAAYTAQLAREDTKGVKKKFIYNRTKTGKGPSKRRGFWYNSKLYNRAFQLTYYTHDDTNDER